MICEEIPKKVDESQRAKNNEGSWEFEYSWKSSGDESFKDSQKEERFHIGDRKWVKKG